MSVAGCVYLTGHLRTYRETRDNFAAARAHVRGGCVCQHTGTSFEHDNVAHGVKWPGSTSSTPDAVRREATATYQPSLLLLANQSDASLVPPAYRDRRYHATDALSFAASVAAVQRLHAGCSASEVFVRDGVIFKTRPDLLLSSSGVSDALNATGAWLRGGGSRRVLAGCMTKPDGVSDAAFVTTAETLDLWSSYDLLGCVDALHSRGHFHGPYIDTCFAEWLRRNRVHLIAVDLQPQVLRKGGHRQRVWCKHRTR
jgi:hypothetical protein